MFPVFSPPPICRDLTLERSWTCPAGLSRRSNVSKGPGFRVLKHIVALVSLSRRNL